MRRRGFSLAVIGLCGLAEFACLGLAACAFADTVEPVRRLALHDGPVRMPDRARPEHHAPWRPSPVLQDEARARERRPDRALDVAGLDPLPRNRAVRG